MARFWIANSALYFSASLLCLLMVGSVYVLGWNFWSAGGGASIFALMPLLISYGTLYFFKGRDNRLFFWGGVTFWLSLVVVFCAFLYFPGHQEHWPFWIAATYLAIGLLALIQLVAFLVIYRIWTPRAK